MAVVITHFLNGTRVNDPVGWGDFEEEIDRDYDKRFINSKYPADVTFTDGACALLRALYDEGLCNDCPYVATLECDGVTDTIIQGIIILSDIEWLFRSDCPMEAKVSVADDGVGARIINNIRVKVFPTADKTKNGEALTPVEAKKIEFFDTSGVTVVASEGYDWRECMTHLLEFITDNAVGFLSHWYDNLPDTERYALVYGRELRTGDGVSDAPTYSFDELFPEMWKKYNLFAGVVRIGGQPYLRIEQESYWYGSGSVTSFPKQDNLIEKIDADRLYASVVAGSDTYEKDEDNAYPFPFLLLRSFIKEEFAIQGQCNTDNQLDLVSKFVIDTNVIYDVIENAVSDHDEKIFLVQYTDSTDQATIGQYLQPGSDPWLYNEQLLNSNVLQRFSLPGDIILLTGPADPAFQAASPGSQAFWASGTALPATSPSFQTRFTDDFTAPNFDTDNNWGNGVPQGTPVSSANSRYTAEANASGLYSFLYYVPWRAIRDVEAYGTGFSDEVSLYLTAQRRNAADVLISQIQVVDQIGDLSFSSGNYTPNQSSSLSGQFVFYLQAGDYVHLVHTYTYTANAFSASAEVRVLAGAELKTGFVAVGGGTIDFDPDLYRSTLFEFDRFIPLSEWVSLRDDPTQEVSVGPGATLRACHAFNGRRNIKTGACKWLLLTNRASAVTVA